MERFDNMKKILIFIFIFILAFNNSFMYVFAEDMTVSDDELIYSYGQFLNSRQEGSYWRDPIAQGLYYLFSSLGYVGSFGDIVGIDIDSDASKKIANKIAEGAGFVTYDEYVKKYYSDNNTPDDVSDDYITYTKEFVDSFNVEINNYVKDTYGYEVYPACSQNDTWVLNHMKYFAGVSDNAVEIAQKMASNDSVFFYFYTRQQAIFVYMNDVYIIKDSNNNLVTFYDADLNKLDYNYFNIAGSLNYFSSFPGTWYDCTSTASYDGLRTYYRFTKDTKVFNSVSALNDYLYGEKMIYQMGNVSDRITDLTFNVTALNADWKEINEKSLEAILQAIEDKQIELEVDTLTEAELQAVIDTVISSRLDEIKETISAGDQMNQFQNQLIYEKLEQIYKLLSDWYKSENNEIGDIVNNKLEIDFTAITDVLNAILEELKLIKESVDNVEITNITNTTFNTDFDIEIVLKLEPAVDEMKGTFPFCIPWDIYACIELLAHEPEPPRWILPVNTPVGIYYVKIDLSDFQMLSDISRALFSLIFILYLSRLTMKIWEML